ncbi:hypothetical protein [Sinorhizobium fredii]|uniref:hypothetical protein n=1 Tax=Rhizobium fredii TaxID=380 RepID=UPI00055C36E6|nr:hypothetical protein [Sinorhizobium fredii]
MKEYWLATRPDTEISFACPFCANVVSGGVQTPTLEMPGDVEAESSEQIECLQCDKTWAVDLVATKDGLTATILEHPSTPVTLSDILWDSDYWEDSPEPEPRPHGIFEDAYREWQKHLVTIGDKNSGSASQNRMLLVQLYSIVEAYLADAILGLALRDRAVQAKLISVIPSLKDKTVSLATVAETPEIVRDMVKNALQATSFHSLVNVNSMCIKVLGKPILPEKKADRDMLLASVDVRHDCVHRNGRDKDSKVRDDITNEYLERLGRHFSRLASALDEYITTVDFDRQLSVLQQGSSMIGPR